MGVPRDPKGDQEMTHDPSEAVAWNDTGNALHKQKHYDEALAAYEKAITLDPQCAPAWNNKGNVFYDQKRYDEALVLHYSSSDG
jgi:tetratricopeptide (TPR) repeat protein